MAEYCRRQADKGPGRESWLEIAAHWDALARSAAGGPFQGQQQQQPQPKPDKER
jgi:hypothetical protein